MATVRRLTAIGVALAWVLAAPTLAHPEEDGTYAGKDAAWWIAQFEDHEVTPAARAALMKIGAPALPAMAAALGSPSRDVRMGVAHTLADMRVDVTSVLPVVIERLGGDDRYLQRHLVRIIAKAGQAALPYRERILPLIASPDRDTASGALGILAQLGPGARDTLPAILARLETAEPRLRGTLLSTAIAVAPDAAEIVPALDTAMQRADDRERARLLGAAQKLQPLVEGLTALAVRAAEDPATPVREMAASLLGRVALEDPAAMPALIGLLVDKDHGVRQRAAHALGNVGTRAAPAVPALMAVLQDADGTAHVAAIRALAQIGPASASAFDDVLKVFDTANPSRDLVVATTAFLAASPETTLRALGTDDVRVQDLAIEIVSGWPPERWAGSLEQLLPPVTAALLAREKPSYREPRILDTLARLSADHEAALRALLAMRAARSPVLRDKAAQLLGAQRDRLDLLVELLSSSDATERAFAQQALDLAGRMDPHGLRAQLLPLMRHDLPAVRDGAKRLLVRHNAYMPRGAISDADATLLAEAAAALLADPGTSEVASQCLATLGRAALPHAQALAELLDRDPEAPQGSGPAWILARLAGIDEEAKAQVLPLLVSRVAGDEPVRAARAAAGLTPFPEHDGLLIEVLPALMRHPSKAVHFPAVDAARHLGQRARPLVPQLVALVETPIAGSHVHQWAVNALGTIAPDDERAVRALVAGLAAPRNEDAFPAFLDALRRGGDTTLRLVAEALEGADAPTCVKLLQVLATYGLRASTWRGSVKPLLESPDARVSQAAAATVKALGG